jgi:hypothetical protein
MQTHVIDLKMRSILLDCSVIHLPQILIGASSSSRMGCEINISLERWQSSLISASVSYTGLPGLEPRTSSSRSIIPSTSNSAMFISFDNFLLSACSF